MNLSRWTYGISSSYSYPLQNRVIVRLNIGSNPWINGHCFVWDGSDVDVVGDGDNVGVDNGGDDVIDSDFDDVVGSGDADVVDNDDDDVIDNGDDDVVGDGDDDVVGDGGDILKLLSGGRLACQMDEDSSALLSAFKMTMMMMLMVLIRTMLMITKSRMTISIIWCNPK